MNDEIKEIKINKASKSITFINNGIAFSQFGIADEILDLITNLQQENERLKKANAVLEENWLAYMKINQKAIEYIKNCEIIDKDKSYPLLEEQFGEDLLNILQNGGKI